MKELERNRIKLRKWRLEDCEDLYEYASLPNIGPNAGWQPHKDINESKEIIKNFIKEEEVYAIEIKSLNKVIGSIGFHNRKIDEKYKKYKQREIAVVINPKYWGNEYAGEAINLLINYGFEVLKIDFVWMCHHLENRNSKRMIEKCKFDYVFEKDVTLERLNNKTVRMLYYIRKNEAQAIA